MASTSSAASSSRDREPKLPEDELEACRELQEDELLALEAIYEQNFSYSRDDRGRLALCIKIEADLQEEREVTVIEQEIQAFMPQLKPKHSQETNLPPSRGRGRGRGARDGHNGRGQRHEQQSAHGRDEPAHPHPYSGHDNKCLDMAKVAAVLPEVHPVPPPPHKHKLKLQYLLPIELLAILPSSYPLHRAPLVRLSSPWLSANLKRALIERIEPLWQNDVSTFMMVDEISASLPDPSFLPDPLILQDRYFAEPGQVIPRNSLQSQLVTYDRLTRHSTFSSESFDCGICLETKKGARCSRIRSCGHVFCIECLHSFFELNIREGLVKNVCCADMECVKQRGKGDDKRGMVEMDEIEAIVGKELLERYQWLMEKQELESDPTVTYCPRDGCNAAVPKENDEEYERLRICPKCSYSFCVYCRRTYHGTKSRCVFSQSASIVDKYVNGSDSERAALETRYGKTNIKRMVDIYIEEQANAQWIKENSTACPNCQLNIERSMGCAHMTCGRCECHFCFRCGARLNAKDPYAHYSTPGYGCYQMLFDFQPSTDNQFDEALLHQFAEFDEVQ